MRKVTIFHLLKCLINSQTKLHKSKNSQRNLPFELFNRPKGEPCCADSMNARMTEIQPGQYWTAEGPFTNNCK